MKNNLWIAALAGLGLLAACEKNDALSRRGQVQTGAGLKFLHMSPDAPVVNVLADTMKVISSAPIAGGAESGIAFGTIAPGLAGGYALVSPGARMISFQVPASSATMGGQTLASQQATLELGKFYSVALVNFAATPEAVIVEDDLSIPDTSKAYVRIANFLPGAKANVEFQFTSGASLGTRFTRDSLAFKSVSNFEPIAPETYKILLRANSSAARLDSITAFTPLKGRKYTLYTRGQIGGTSTKRPLIFQSTTL